GDHGGGDGGDGGSFSFLLIVLFLRFRSGGVGPQKAQTAQKLSFWSSAFFATYVAKAGRSRTLEANFNAKARRRGGAQGRRCEGRSGGSRRDGSFAFFFIVLFLRFGPEPLVATDVSPARSPPFR